MQNRAEYCSETETEGSGFLDNGSDASNSPIKDMFVSKSLNSSDFQEFSDDAPLVSLIRSSKKLSRAKISPSCGAKTGGSGKVIDTSQRKRSPSSSVAKCTSNDIDYQQPTGRKRIRVVLSDDEVDEHAELDGSSKRFCEKTVDDMATPDEGWSQQV